MNLLRFFKSLNHSSLSRMIGAFTLTLSLSSFAFGSVDLLVGVNETTSSSLENSQFFITDVLNGSSEVTVFASESISGANDIVLALSGEKGAKALVNGKVSQRIQESGDAILAEGFSAPYYLWNLGKVDRTDWEYAFRYDGIDYYSKTMTIEGFEGEALVRAFADNDNDFYFDSNDDISGYFNQAADAQSLMNNAFPKMIIGENGQPIFSKAYDGDREVNEDVITTVGPHLLVDDVQIEPMANDHNDVLLSLCDSRQTWTLLKEYTNWLNVNMLGYYTDPGTGTNQSTVFWGPDSEGYTFTTNIPGGDSIGLWLLNDTNNDQVFNGNDSYLFSERFLTRNSFANEHQWFMVYDVRGYKGNNSTYEFICPSEDYTTSGDFDYLIYIDDDHTSANWDHNDMILGVYCNNPPVAECPGDTTLFVCELGEICIPGFSCSDVDGNLESCEVSPGTLSGGSVCFTPTSAGAYTITLIATDTSGDSDTSQTVVTVELNTPPTAICPGDQTLFVCDDTEDICIPGFNYSDPDDNVTGVQVIGCELHQDTVCFTPEGPNKTITYIVTDACGASDTCETNITLNYNHAPEVNCPGDTSIFVCDYSEICIPGFTYSDLDDNIESVQIIGCEIHEDTVCFIPEGPTKTITLIVTDECGVADTCYTNIDIVLNSPPVAHGPFDGSKPGVFADTTVFLCDLEDICIDGFYCSDPDNNLASCTAVGGTLSGTEICFTPVEGLNELMLIAVDDCGEADTSITTVDVFVNTPPTATCPGDTALFLCDTGSNICLTGFSSSDDDDNIVSETVSLGTLSGGTVCFTPAAGINTIVYTVVDACGDTAQCQTVVNVGLNVPPQASCPGDTTIFLCEPGGDICLDGFVAYDANDNITSAVVDLGTLSGTEVCFTPVEGLNTITFTVTDGCGEISQCATNITVELNSNPTVSCPGDTSIFLCEPGEICLDGFSYSDADDNITDVTVTGGTLTGTEVCFTPVEGVNTITLEVTDACGQTDQCTANITVAFNHAPVVACPGDQQMTVCDLSEICIDGFSYSDVDDNITDVTVTGGTLTGTEVCFTPVEGVNTITLEVTDACGQTDQCTTNITVAFNHAPVVACPGDQQMTVCDLSEICIDGFSYSDADDNITDVTVTGGTLTGTEVCFTPVEGVNTITLTVTDACGQTDQCTTNITIDLNDAPVVSCPGDIDTLLCSTGEICLDGFSYNDADDNITDVTVTGGTLTGTEVCFTPVEGVNTITLEVTDACGQTDQCTTNITVAFNHAPVVACPGDQQMTVCDLSEICIDGFSYSDVDDNITDVTVTGGTLTGTEVCFTPVEGVNTITLTVTDACGQTDQCTTNITVNLNDAPVVSCPGDDQMTVCDLSEICLDGFSYSDADDNITDVTVTGGTLTGTEVCFTPVEGVNTITLTVTDACGQTDQCTTNITIDLNDAPVVSCPGDIDTLLCSTGEICLDGFSYSDADDNITDVTVTGGTLTGTEVCFTPVEGVNTITLEVTDACGQTDQCTTNITVAFNHAPVVACPGDQQMTVCDLSEICLDGFSYSDVDDNITDVTVTGGTLAGSQVCFTPVEGVNTITLTVTDACGQTDQCTTNITVNLNDVPVVSCPGDDQMTVCDLSEICLDGFSYSDADDNITDVTVTGGTLTGTEVCFTPVEGVNTITLTVTDACGQTDQCTTNITISLNNPPVATCPGDNAILVCDLSEICVDGFSFTDPDDNITSIDIDGGTLAGSQVCFTPIEGVNTITATVTDACGEQDVCVTEITVALNSQPVVNCPGDEDLSVCDLSEICIDGFSYSDADDNITDVTVTGGTLTGTEVCFTPVEGVNTITLAVTDACGEVNQCQTDITVTLNTPPVATCPGNLDMLICDLNDICLDGFVATDIDDNITDVTVAGGTLTGSQVCFTPAIGINTITMTVTDACGEADQCFTEVNISLNSAPTVICPNDTVIQVGELTELCVDGFIYADADDNIQSAVVDNGTLTGTEVCFTPVEGLNTITLTVTDECGLYEQCTTEITIILNTCPEIVRPLSDTTSVCVYEDFCDTIEVIDADGDMIEMTTNYGGLIPIIDEPGHWLGLYCFYTEDYDCDEHNQYEIVIECDDGLCIDDVLMVYEVTVLGYIDMHLDENVYVMPGMTGLVGVYLDTYDCLCVGSISSSIDWDPSILNLVDVYPAANLDFGEEYHNIHIDAFGPGTVKLTYIADLNNQVYHGPLCDIDPTEPIFYLEFQLEPDEYPTDFVIPICFTNEDEIQDNAVADSTGYHVWWGDGCSDQPDSSQFGTWKLNMYCGSIIVINDCDLVLGDLNMNRLPFEVGDVVLLANHLIDPMQYSFSDAQMAASDVNEDEIEASVADLIMMINVINGSTTLGKIAPPTTPTDLVVAHQSDGSAIIQVEAEYEVGGLLLEIPIPDLANHSITYNSELEMNVEITEMNDKVRVLVYSENGATLPAGSSDILRIDNATGFHLSPSELYVSSAQGALANTVVSYEMPLPETFGIANCFPNPFNPVTNIEFTMPEADYVSLTIYDVTGRKVTELVSGYLDAGYHQVVWNATNGAGDKIASGIYFAKLKADNENIDVSMEKLVLLK